MREEKKQQLNQIIEEFKTVKKEKLNIEASFIKSEVYDCTLNNGKTIRREKIVKQKKDGSAAIVLPITKNNDVLLTVEPRVFSKRTVGIGIPAAYNELFLALDCEKKKEQNLDNGEYIKYFDCTFDEAIELIDEG